MTPLSLTACLVLSLLSLLVPSVLSQSAFTFTTQTSNGFTGRQQGGLLIVASPGSVTSVATSAGSSAVAAGSLIIYGGQIGSAGVNDVWYSSNSGQQLSSVTIAAASPYVAQSYGPATCVDNTKQILYSIGGDESGGGSAGTSQVYYSLDLGQRL